MSGTPSCGQLRDSASYFFGTIHVPYMCVWDFIPENCNKAFQQSHIVDLELDLTDPFTISALTSCQLLPQGKNLQDVLPHDIYHWLKQHLKYVKFMMPCWMTPDQQGKGLYADYLFNATAGNWEQKRPVWVMLMVNSLTEVNIKSRGVPVLDLFLAQEVEQLRKQTGAVKKVEEQCHPLNGPNFSQVRQSGVQGARLAAELGVRAATAWTGAQDHFMVNYTVIDVLRREGYEVEHTPAGQAINNPYIMSHELSLHSQREEEEEEEYLLHLLFSDSTDVLMKVDRNYKKKEKQQQKQRLRKFKDPWVHLEESATDPSPWIRIINGYITVEPNARSHGQSSHTCTFTNSAHQLSHSLFFPLLTLTLCVVVHTPNDSWFLCNPYPHV